ncbi:MAG TPA: hypothetical protein VGP72_01705 [Planctomycetota bacterium]|jgi:hypothetical protein
MKTTVEIPEELLQLAKADAERRGVTLTDLVTEALSHELRPAKIAQSARRVKFPLIHSRTPGQLNLTNRQIEELLD